MITFSKSFRQIAATLSLAFLAVLTLGSRVSAQDDKTLLGAGSTFIYPLFSKMFSDYNTRTGIQVNYQSIGSGGGILQLTNKTVDFGASDAPLNDEQATKIGVPVLHIPQASGAVVVTYNLPGENNNISLTPDIIADIFLGKIKTWNDPRITGINKGVTIPGLPILVAHRSDGSGTTNIFTNYLSKVSADWKAKVGNGMIATSKCRQCKRQSRVKIFRTILHPLQTTYLQRRSSARQQTNLSRSSSRNWIFIRK